MNLIAVIKDAGFQGDGTVLMTLALSHPDGRTTNKEAVIDNPGSVSTFKSSIKQAARDLAQQEWGLVVNNANTLLVGE